MEKVIVTDEVQLNELYHDSALTMEGLQEVDIPKFLDWLTRRTVVIRPRFYITKGAIMNTFYHLTGTNAYPDNLPLVSIKLSDIEVEPIVLTRFDIGARWFDDIVDNNVRREDCLSSNI